MRSLPSGIQVASFSVATNRVWKDKNGAKQESTDYHNIVVFGRQAEIVNQFLRKGSSVLVEGRIQTRSWDGPDGNKKYKTEIVADRVQFGPKKNGGEPAGAAPAVREAGEEEAPPIDTIEYPADEVNVDDIPF